MKGAPLTDAVLTMQIDYGDRVAEVRLDTGLDHRPGDPALWWVVAWEDDDGQDAAVVRESTLSVVAQHATFAAACQDAFARAFAAGQGAPDGAGT